MYTGANVNNVSEAWYKYFSSSIEHVCEKKIFVDKKKNLAPQIDNVCVIMRKELVEVD